MEARTDVNVQKLVTAFQELSDQLTQHRTIAILRHLKKNDLTLNQYSILYFIDLHGPCLPIQLADLMQLKAATITYLVDSLENRGLVQRTPNPQDGRSHYVSFTDTGQQMVIETKRGPSQAMLESFAKMDHDEAENLYLLMKLLKRKLLPK